MDENKFTESISEWYDRIIQAGYYENNTKIADTLSNILEHRRKILEIGIGTGLIAEQLIAKGYDVSGFDFTKAMLDIARKRLGKNAKLYQQNILELDLPETYEAAFSQGGLWYATREKDGRFFWKVQ